MERVPCASLLIRVEKAPQGANNRPMSLVSATKAEISKFGLSKVAPKYNTGAYNTQYYDLNSNEMVIFREKSQRPNPLAIDTLHFLFHAKAKDKKVKARIKKGTRKK